MSFRPPKGEITATFLRAIRAEAEAADYVGRLGEYLGFCDANCTGSATLGDGAEVYSLMREVTLDPRGFIDRYHDDGTEKSEKV